MNFRFPLAFSELITCLITCMSAGLITLASSTMAHAQITPAQTGNGGGNRLATLEEQLVNRLRATREDQQAYIHFVVDQVRMEKLDAKLVVAIERYAMRRNRGYPFPFFEAALRYEAAKRGIELPAVDHFASTKGLPPRF